MRRAALIDDEDLVFNISAMSTPRTTHAPSAPPDRSVAARRSLSSPLPRRNTRRRQFASRSMDKYRKQQRKRELAKNKARRAEARSSAAQRKDVSELEEEREKLERAKRAPPPGARVREDKIDERLRWLSKQIEQKSASDAADRAAGRPASRARPRTLACTAYAVGAERERKPEDSVYWHPTLNPTGRPPPGKPQKWKAGVGAEAREGDAGVRALPAGTSGRAEAETRVEESDEDDDAMPPPPGPPPGFEIVIPEVEKSDNATEDALEANVDKEDDDGEPLPPPPLSPPRDDDDDEPLPPPPMPPPSVADDGDGTHATIERPKTETTTTVVHRAPMGTMPRPPPPQRRAPPPQRRDAGFFATPRAVASQPRADPSTFTKSAAPTAAPTIRAEHNTALKALVPASVRVKRQEAPDAKRPRVAAGRSINAAPNVQTSSATGSGNAQDDKYLSFLDEMAELGAFSNE